jgi:hypothetical protein
LRTNENSFRRREFLKTARQTALALAGPGLLGRSSSPAVEPLKRPGAPRLRLGLAAYSFLARVVKLLRDANDQGYFVLEYEAPEDPWEAVPKLLKQMPAALAAEWSRAERGIYSASTFAGRTTLKSEKAVLIQTVSGMDSPLRIFPVFVIPITASSG